jgi:FMN phosphatase YigB (HAD superfamily)
MKLIALGQAPRALIFDLDNTLYTHAAYAEFQERALIDELARAMGIGAEGAAARIAEMRAEREASGAGATSLANIFAGLGFDIATSVRWREETIEPSEWLRQDKRLDYALAELSRRYRLALVTNNPRSVGEKSLEALGVRSHFAAVVGLDSTMLSKPAPEPFILAAALLGSAARECVSIGDRYSVDLVPALDLGMGAILVSGAEDIYALPDILDEKRNELPQTP